MNWNWKKPVNTSTVKAPTPLTFLHVYELYDFGSLKPYSAILQHRFLLGVSLVDFLNNYQRLPNKIKRWDAKEFSGVAMLRNCISVSRAGYR